MTTIGSHQAKTHLPELIERVGHGEKIVITRRGVPVALLTQPPPIPSGDNLRVAEEMLAFRDRHGPTLGNLAVRDLIDEGRRY